MKKSIFVEMAKKGLAFVQRNARTMMVMCLVCTFTLVFAQDGGGGDAGITAMEGVKDKLINYIPAVRSLCYALAGIVAVVGAISVYIKMNNEEQDVKKSIMMIVGACIFLIAAAEALPLFFGITGE